jgi:hypothetical protein
MFHNVHDAVGLALAQRIAAGLPSHPEWIDLARNNLERWSRLNGNSPTLLACYREWQSLLDRSVDEIAAALLAPSDTGQRLRQNSPFAGVIPASEVRLLKRQIHESTPT